MITQPEEDRKRSSPSSMEEYISPFNPSKKPLIDSQFSEDVLRFWLEDSDLNFTFDPPQKLQELTHHHEPTISLPTFIPEESAGDEVAGLSDPFDDPIFNNILDDLSITGDLHVGHSDFQNGSIGQEQAENPKYPNTMALTVWPPPPVPFSCSCCQLLRDIIHTNGIHTTKLEVHGRIGLISHAILEIRYNVDGCQSVEHQMIDFSMQSTEDVKQFLMQYCQERKQAGFVMSQDPLLKFYTAVCAGLSLDDTVNTVEFIQPFGTQTQTEAYQMSQPEEESNVIKQSKTSLAAQILQRERTGRLKLSDLAIYFHLPIEVAAKRLAICPTVLKKICRKHGMPRWPHRKIKSMERQILNLQLSLRDKDGEESAVVLAEIERLKQERDRVCNIVVQ